MIKVGVQNAGIIRGVCAARCCIQSSHLYSGLGFFSCSQRPQIILFFSASVSLHFGCKTWNRDFALGCLLHVCLLFCNSKPTQNLYTLSFYTYTFFPQTLFLTKQTHLPGDKSVFVSIVLLIVSRSFRLWADVKHRIQIFPSCIFNGAHLL